MTFLEAIKARRSVRTFNGEAPSEEELVRLRAEAGKIENPYGIKFDWAFLDASEKGLSSPVIVGERMYVAGKSSRTPHIEEAFGYSFEKLLLCAQTMGLGSCWIAGTMDRKVFEKAIDLQSGEAMPSISPIGRPSAKMSLRETVMRKGINADNRREFGQLFFDGFFDRPLTMERAGKYLEALEAVRRAPSAVNRQPWRVVLTETHAHFYERQSTGYVRDGFDLQKVDLGIALCHFDLALNECGLPHTFEIKDPGLPTEPYRPYIASYVLQ